MLCFALRSWKEESAWACYRAAECLSALGQHRQAFDRCAGLAPYAGVAEVAWLGAICAYRLEDYEQAVCWARLAIVHGSFEGCGTENRRIGFRYPPGLYEGPYDVLRYALRALGDSAGADKAEARCSLALAA